MKKIIYILILMAISLAPVRALENRLSSDRGSSSIKIDNKSLALKKLDEATRGEEILGTWLDNFTGLKQLIRISKSSDGKYKDTTIFLDTPVDTFNQSLKKLGDKYFYENSFGEFYLIKSDGSLAWYDKQGLMATLKRVSM